MNARNTIYNALVNRQPGIAVRYHRMHDRATGGKKLLSWFYLLWLNFCYYVLFQRSLGVRPGAEPYESRSLLTEESESARFAKEHPELNVEAFVQKAAEGDMVSFDVFDTLILRPLSQPTDVFHFVGEQLGILNFKELRAQCEMDAREACRKAKGHTEVTLAEIWERLARMLGCDPEEGMRLEQEAELALCCANPFLLAVWNRLRAMGKPILIISDMYLPKSCITRMLEQNGFTGAERVYVSCESGQNKAGGTLFQQVLRDYPGKKIVHVGDNAHSDVSMAERCGFGVCPYVDVRSGVSLYRPADLSPMVGSAYRGLVSNHLYCGLERYSMEYEYGYIYGGLFVLGYCVFIHDWCRRNGADRVLFFSRDGDILKQAYDRLYPEDDTAYAYWSRKASVKLMADDNRHDFFQRFLHQKINQGYSLREALGSMELTSLAEQLPDVGLNPDQELTGKLEEKVRSFLEARWDAVLAAYEAEDAAAAEYYRALLSGCSHAAAVDIGWAGSGAMALRHLASRRWNIPCRITGIVAGTNTVHNTEPEASEPFLQSGALVAYLYSQSLNRDLMKRHDPARDYNVYWELLLSSPTPQVTGFGRNADGSVRVCTGAYDANQPGIREIQRGILDFVEQYAARFAAFPYMLHISGRDAYAPMLVAASRREAYLKAMKKRFDLHVNVE